jgi:serine/threonine protein kinase
VKLADFGLSKRLTDTTTYNTLGGTLSYMAPEILNLLESGGSCSNYTNAIDIWSAGCIIYRLITGVVPFPPGTSLMKYCENIALFPYDALFDKSSITSEGVRFLRQLLMPRPDKRPSASRALKHNWILSGTSLNFIKYDALC